MRWITLLLVVANVVLFGWFWQRDQAAVRMESRQVELPKVPALVLLSERQAPLPERVAGEDGALSEVGAGSGVPEGAPSTGSLPEAVADTVAASKEAEAPGEDPGASAEPDPAEELADSIAPVAVDDTNADTEAPVAVALACYRLSYFASRVEAEAWLEGRPLRASSITEERLPAEPDYWVYIPDPGKSTKRRALRQELGDMGFESYWVQRGRLKGQLSLGLYRNKESAESLYHLLQARGYAAEIFLNPRSVIRYSVEIEGLSSEIRSADWAVELAEMRPAIKTEKKPCQGLASAQLPE